MSLSLDQIKIASRKMLLGERTAGEVVSETCPASISAAILAFCETLGAGTPEFLPVIDDKYGLYGWCSDGVREKVLYDSGSPVFGWTIWEWPNVLLTAEFHCVWRSNSGDLFDITPKPHSETQILFLPDYSYEASFDFDKRPRNKRARLFQGPDRAEIARGKLREMKGPKLEYETKRAEKAGMSIEDYLAHRLPLDSVSSAIEEFISICDAFDAHFDSLGGAGPIQADARLRELMKARIVAQSKMNALLKDPNIADRGK